MVNIASVSGGKDSTAMLILLAEKGVKLDHVVYINTTIDFPQTVRFVRTKLNEFVREHFGLDIEVICPKRPFSYYFSKYGVPYAPKGRWCTRVLKRDPFYYWFMETPYDSAVLFVGYTIDEKERYIHAKSETERYWKHRRKSVSMFAPLIEYGITEEKALEMCKEYDLLNPIYKHFDRNGCWLCPYQRKSEWYKLWKYYPELWRCAKILERKSVEMGKHTLLPRKTLEDLELEFIKHRKIYDKLYDSGEQIL